VVFNAVVTELFNTDVSRFFAGSPTDNTIRLMIGGIAAVAVGLTGLLHSQPK